MIELDPQMPAGTVGIRASGKITDEDYREVLSRPWAKGCNEERQALYVLEKDFSYSAGAAWEDTKPVGRHLTGWQQVAVASDADWLEHNIQAFGWLMPGEIRVFESRRHRRRTGVVGGHRRRLRRLKSPASGSEGGRLGDGGSDAEDRDDHRREHGQQWPDPP